MKELVKKFTLIQSDIGLPMLFLAATNDDKYRKPSTAAWDWFVSKNGLDKVNKSASFYCGDAAGRPKTDTKPKDFSDGDRKFAINIGLNFKLPE